MQIIVVDKSVFVFGPPFLELQITRWGFLVRDWHGRKLGLVRAAEA